ncbi:hypothetical protein Sps_03952 [Shewanella psychrophila]|uniref:Uncharacterized protein n=1 Tax=Shewanella psychrophila TaxID=225848 RepID=A0A1S6HU23_9GAMM|nr:hypothetical protein [Shewanella psychrophila]AQS39067.1 hypothetical protein Sps_03952 [Shewanella psychrophila]
MPAASAGARIKIIATGGGTALDAGQFTLTKTADITLSHGAFDITSASPLSFDVATDDASEDHVDYYYTLTSSAYAYSGGSFNTFNAPVGLTADPPFFCRIMLKRQPQRPHQPPLA